MRQPAIALACSVVVHLLVPLAVAEPILKPRKYYGPIPQSSLTLRVGFFGGADNQEMIRFLDGQIQEPFEAFSEDFGNGLSVDVAYVYKPHPQFGLRASANVTLLRSDGNGNFFATEDSLLIYDYDRNMDVEVITLEASGIYFFTDAAVKEFQPYLGGGFTVGLPHERFKETRVESDTGAPYQEIDLDEWSVEAGVHAVLGAVYYVTNSVGVSTEGRFQFMEGRFDRLQTPNEVGEPENVSFVVDYTGFYLAVGATWGF